MKLIWSLVCLYGVIRRGDGTIQSKCFLSLVWVLRDQMATVPLHRENWFVLIQKHF